LRRVGEVAGIGPDPLQQLHAVDPPLAHGPGFEVGGRGGGLGRLQGVQPALHLLLDDILEGLRHRTALGWIRERDFPHQARIAQVTPLRGRTLDPETLERDAIENDPVRAQHRADPEPLAVPVILAAVAARDHGVAEPGRMRLEHSGVDQPAGLRLTLEVVGAAAKEEVDAASDIGRQKRPARFLHDRGRVSCQPGVLKTGLNLRAPRFAEGARPVMFECRHVFALEKTRDLTRAAHDPPVDRDRAAGPALVPVRKSPREFVADGFVVRRDDDQRVVRLGHAHPFGSQHERHCDDHQQREDDEQSLHSASTTTSSGTALANTSPRSD
jgi:hypothetical protein